MAYSESQPDTRAPHVDPYEKEPKKKRVVVLGTGWAGTSLLKDLDASLYDIQVVSPRNYFAFTPLLPSVTCGTVEARSIVEPIRNIVKKVRQNKRWKNIYIYIGIRIMLLFFFKKEKRKKNHVTLGVTFCDKLLSNEYFNKSTVGSYWRWMYSIASYNMYVCMYTLYAHTYV